MFGAIYTVIAPSERPASFFVQKYSWGIECPVGAKRGPTAPFRIHQARAKPAHFDYAFFFAVAFFLVTFLPDLAARSAISSTAWLSVRSAGAIVSGMVALIFSHFT